MNKTDQLVFIDSRKTVVRVLLAALVAAAIIAAVYGAARQFGRSFAETYQPLADNARETARLAVRLAPNDSQARLIAAKAARAATFGNSSETAENNFVKAAQFAPHDYRFWLELGRNREQTGDRAGGEAALRRAVELAPNYAYPRWFLGNLLLRDDRRDAAFAEFERAAENHSALRRQVFYLVWETTGGDAAELKKLFGDTAQVRAALAAFYAEKKLPNESIAAWQSLSETEKADNRDAAELAMQVNYDNYNYLAVAFFSNDLKKEAVEPGKVTNASFEDEILPAKQTVFNWRVEQLKNAEIAVDARNAHTGARSLRLTFKGFSEPTLQAAQQLVVVAPNARYRLQFWFKTADLKSAGMPLIEIADARAGKILGASEPFPANTNNWQNQTIEFTTAPDTTGVWLRTARTFCGADCPIVGALWYDDFTLEQIKK